MPTNEISLPADPSSLEALRRFLFDALAGTAEEEADRIVLAVQEAATNYMKYAAKAAEGCPLEVCVAIEAGRLTVRIPYFCPRGVEEAIRPRELDDVRPGGLGTHFLREIMDEIDYEPGEEGQQTLVLRKTLGAVEGSGA
jgi:sigma-B regulation protein RsbU (phosphoserine phosphatase)